jgi:hypothetical protein
MAIMDTKLTHYWQFEGSETIHSAEGWRLESAIMETRHQLGLPIWQSYKILKNYAPTLPVPATASDSSSVSDSDVTNLVPKRTRKAKVKLQTMELQSMPLVVDITNPLDLVPTTLRDKFTNGLSNTVSDSDSLRSDSQETK